MSSIYEDNLRRLILEKRRLLSELESMDKKDPIKIESVKEEIRVLESLYENYVSSMGVFRKSKGAREEI